MMQAEGLFRRALEVLPGGVSRDTVLRKPHPLYAAKGEGCIVTDVDGREFLDCANNMASLIHGHAYAPVMDAVARQLRGGTCFSFATEIEIEFAEHMCGRSAAFEKIRFMNSGTEGVMAMIKAARAYTGRPKIAKVEGAYHGAYDYVEVSQMSSPERWGSPLSPNSVPLAAGTPQGVVDDVIVIPFNDSDAAIRILDQQAASIAGVLVDLIPHRVGLVPADTEFVHRLREWTSRNGALLLFDEVITFRTTRGGAQALYSAKPDLTALGKAIGGGFPVGAVAGRGEVMDVFAAGRHGLRLPQSGTFSANPVTMVAGLVAMQHFDPEKVAWVNQLGEQARRGIREAIAASGVPACVTGAGSMFRIHLRPQEPRNYRDTYLDERGRNLLAQFNDGLFDEGIMMTNTGTGMLSTVMQPQHVERLVAVVSSSLRRLAR
jgi:glutamate-1-semialdehyde 2,1-aminomutase